MQHGEGAGRKRSISLLSRRVEDDIIRRPFSSFGRLRTPGAQSRKNKRCKKPKAKTSWRGFFHVVPDSYRVWCLHQSSFEVPPTFALNLRPRYTSSTVIIDCHNHHASTLCLDA